MSHESPFIADRAMIDHAVALLDAFGAAAAMEAAMRAERSRERGNVVHFCRWREVERLLDALAVEDAPGTLH